MTDIPFEEIKEILKNAIDKSNTPAEALENVINEAYRKGLREGSKEGE